MTNRKTIYSLLDEEFKNMLAQVRKEYKYRVSVEDIGETIMKLLNDKELTESDEVTMTVIAKVLQRLNRVDKFKRVTEWMLDKVCKQ